jgi:phosphate-selective porin OprO/OprP
MHKNCFLRTCVLWLGCAVLAPASLLAQTGIDVPPVPVAPDTGVNEESAPAPENFDSMLQDLRQRIDSVEVENQQLRQRLDNFQPPEVPKDAGSPLDMKAAWNNGIEWKTKDKKFRFHVGGRVQFDSSFFDASDAIQTGPGGVGQLKDGVDFRRARLRMDGTMYENIDWTTEFDFVNSQNVDPLNPAQQTTVANVPVPTDLWVNFSKIPFVGNIRVGNFKEYIGFEHLTSSRHLNFMERSYNQDAFTGPFNNGFSQGIGVHNTVGEDENGTLAIGLFKNQSNAYGWGVGDGEYAVTGRATRLLVYEDEGERLVHIGAGFSHRDTQNDQLRIRARGSVRSGPPALWNTYANTGLMSADTQDLIGGEFVVVHHSWTFQSEYMVSIVDGVHIGGMNQGRTFFQGGYGELLYFLTGEHQHYGKKAGHFERTNPIENFHVADGEGCSGWGAWQAGVRYNFLDLDDSGINGNKLNTVVFGLNWFLNPNMKVQWNYDITKRNTAGVGADGYIHAFGTRVAYDY